MIKYLTLALALFSSVALADPRLKITVASPVLQIGQSTTVTFNFDEVVAGFTAADIVINPATGGSITNFSGSGQVYTATFTKLGSETSTAISTQNNAYTSVATGATGFGDSIGVNTAPILYINEGALFSTKKIKADPQPRCPKVGEYLSNKITGAPETRVTEKYYTFMRGQYDRAYGWKEVEQGCLTRPLSTQEFRPKPTPSLWETRAPNGVHHHSTKMPAINLPQMPYPTGTRDILLKPNNHDAVWDSAGNPVEGHVEASGAFRVAFSGFKFLNDDPILYPNQQGRAHLHAFFGNMAVDFTTTIANIRANCVSVAAGGGGNCTGYWQPTLFDMATNTAVELDTGLFYYKATTGGILRQERLPVGLRMIAGNPFATTEISHANFTCFNRATGTSSGGQTQLPSCKWPQYDHLEAHVSFPACVQDDGNGNPVLDSPDHQSHVVYQHNPSIPTYPNSGSQMFGNNHPVTGTPVGRNWCPTSHPHLITELRQIFIGKIKAGQDTATWRLSSDNYDLTVPAGLSLHGDWMNGWMPEIEERFFTNCNRSPIDCGINYIGLNAGIGISSITTSGTTATITTTTPHRLTNAILVTQGGAPFTLKGRISGITGPEADKFNFDATSPSVLRPFNDMYEGPMSAVISVGSQPLTIVSPTQISYTLNSAPSSGAIASGLTLTNAKLQWGESLCQLGERGCVPSYYKHYYPVGN